MIDHLRGRQLVRGSWCLQGDMILLLTVDLKVDTMYIERWLLSAMRVLMKDTKLLLLLVHIIKHHTNEGGTLDPSYDDLVLELEEEGFRQSQVREALDWLEILASRRDAMEKLQLASSSTRVFSDFERQVLGQSGCNYLLSLENMNILNAETKELVIDRVLALQEEGVNEYLIQWVTLVVLYGYPQHTHALKRMELLVYDEFEGMH